MVRSVVHVGIEICTMTKAMVSAVLAPPRPKTEPITVGNRTAADSQATRTISQIDRCISQIKELYEERRNKNSKTNEKDGQCLIGSGRTGKQ